MDWLSIQKLLLLIQHYISFAGVLIILSGVLFALCQYLYFIFSKHPIKKGVKINEIRLTFGRILILGLEFIVAADLIGTTTTPDYYAVGIVAIIVLIRTLLSYTLNKEIMSLSKSLSHE